MTQCHPHSCHLCLLSVRPFPTVRLCQGPLAWGVCSFEGSRGSRRQALAFPWLCAAYIPWTLRPYCVFSVSQLFIHTIPSASGPETLTKARNLPVRLVRKGKRMKVSSSVSLSSFLFPSGFLPPNFLSSFRQKQNPMSIGLLPPACSTQTTAPAYRPRCSAANIIL